MMDLIQIFQEEWAIRALLASCMVGLMCGVLGSFIVLRNMALIGDALAHAILPGVVFAFVIVGYSTLGFFVGSVIAGLFSAVCMTWIQHNIKTKNDAAIGIVFTAMFSIGVMGISYISNNEGVHLDLNDFLFGTVLGVSNEDLYLTGAITLYVLFSVVVFYRYLFITTFQEVIAQTMGISVKMIHYFLMLLLSFAVVASLQTVGVILVVAMLITPASTALLLSDRLKWVVVISAILGLISAILGLLLAIVYETTPGPAMAVTATIIYLLAATFSPKKGLVFRFFQKRKLRNKIHLEDTLKQALKLHQKRELSKEKLSNKLQFSPSLLQKQLSKLNSLNYIKTTGQELSITKKGIEAANKLVRAHRLWETYLVNKIGLTEEQIHEDAEKYEHLLTEELLDEVDEQLGYPKKDPHGSPIPEKYGGILLTMFKMEMLQQARIANKQLEEVSTELWKRGLLPNEQFLIQKKAAGFVQIEYGGNSIKLPNELAKKINIELAN